GRRGRRGEENPSTWPTPPHAPPGGPPAPHSQKRPATADKNPAASAMRIATGAVFESLFFDRMIQSRFAAARSPRSALPGPWYTRQRGNRTTLPCCRGMIMEPERFDAIVLGTGQAGKPLALDLAGAGRRTAVVEREYVGGTCVNVGCTPTKTMVASARVAYLARRADEYGVRCGPVAVDMTQVRRRKQTIVDDFRTGGQRRLEQAENVELIFGEGRFTAPKVVELTLKAGGARTLTADAIFINTGARP